MSGEQAQALLAGACPGKWEARFGQEWATVWTSYGHYTLAERVHPQSAPLLAAAPDLARQVIALSAENATLLAENARLQAQAGAVAGLAKQWDAKAQMFRSNVPDDYAERTARDFHALGRAGAWSDCAVDLMTALAQASAEGEPAGAQGVGR